MCRAGSEITPGLSWLQDFGPQVPSATAGGSSIVGTLSWHILEQMHFTAQVRNVPASLCVSQPQTHPQHSRRAAGTAFHVTRQQKPYPKHPSLLFKFAKICMVGVKENIVNCTILLTPKSNFFCLVYLDFSVCFVVKQPTRVVVHKTAFES